ncbi:MAG TPA: acyltransferase family protein, partial [Acidimicrobiales bacterium]|nr:acyltransferase family protein [Acidimicrobiales bacterium]
RAVGAPTGPRLWGGVVLLRGVRPPGQTLPFGPLWFLGVYLAVVLVSPITVALHRRFRALVPALMILGAVVTDLGGFVAGHPRVRYLNIAFVLLLPHQLGHFYGDGTLLRQPRRRLWWMTLSGLGGLVLLTNPIVFELFGDRRFTWFPGIGHYPRSLLGTEVEKVSNAYPPTLCYLLAGLWGIGAAMLLRPRLARWLQRERPWRMTIAVNARIMTLFLWHMTAYLLAILLLWPLEFGREREPTIRWWVERPLWLGVSGAILGVIMTIVGPLEALGRDHRTRRSDDDPGASNAME